MVQTRNKARMSAGNAGNGTSSTSPIDMKEDVKISSPVIKKAEKTISTPSLTKKNKSASNSSSPSKKSSKRKSKQVEEVYLDSTESDGTPSPAKEEKTESPIDMKEDVKISSPVIKKAEKTISDPIKEVEKTKAAGESFKFEFGGPIGAVGVMFGLPFVIFSLYFICTKEYCLENPLTFDWAALIARLPTAADLFTPTAITMYLAWMGFHVLCERILPGEKVEGVVLSDGSRLSYTISGHLQFWLTLIAICPCLPVIEVSENDVWSVSSFRSIFLLTDIYDQYVQLIAVSLVGSFLLSCYVYYMSFEEGCILAKGGDTGYHVYDFFIGRALNPRIGSLDLKEFCELRPGLIGWLVINVGMAAAQYRAHGAVSGSMVLVVLFQGFYVWDAVYMEKAILTTMDITTDGFGFMLAFGDLSWVPFIYSLQARYLVDHDPNLPIQQLVVITLIHFAGYYIFRSANSEKDCFRRDPNSPDVRHLEYLATKRGTKLLTSGWWGAARKINYTGDWLVTFSWCLLCGYSSPVPYFQAIYFMILLIHRADRDDQMCHEKYGDDWLEYKKKVPCCFVPGVV